MTKQTVQPKKRRGPAPTGKGLPVQVRLQPAQLEALDAWIAALKGADLRPAQGLQAKGNNVTSIVRYLETGDYGEKTGRQLIAEVDAKPRAPAARATWTADPSFDLATELLNAPSFKPVVESVLKNGYEIVEIGRKLKK